MVPEIVGNRAFAVGQVIAFQLLFESDDGKFARIVFQDVVHQCFKNITGFNVAPFMASLFISFTVVNRLNKKCLPGKPFSIGNKEIGKTVIQKPPYCIHNHVSNFLLMLKHTCFDLKQIVAKEFIEIRLDTIWFLY